MSFGALMMSSFLGFGCAGFFFLWSHLEESWFDSCKVITLILRILGAVLNKVLFNIFLVTLL